MAIYGKPKRKNVPLPQIPLWKMISSLVSGLFHYGLIVPTRWAWRQSNRLLRWTWHQTKRSIGWIWRQSGRLIIGSWRIISLVTQKTVLAPFIALGRLLGFIAHPIPDGLSPAEAEAYQRINRQFRRQKRWYLHILTFLIGMATLWIPEIFSYDYPRTDMFVMLTLIWLVTLGGHRLWMHLGDSEDRQIDEALHRIRTSQPAVYYEEDIYDEQLYDASRLEEADYDRGEWDDGELQNHTFKSKH